VLHRSDRGATLPEMVVALLIFAVVSAALLSLLLSSAHLVGSSKSRSVAASVAASVIDETRAQGAVAVAPGRTTMQRTVDGRRFTVVRDAQFVTRGADSSCTSPGVPSFLRVRVAVQWPGMGTVRPVETDTLLTPGVGDVDTATGSIAVSVVDAAGAPLPDVPVTLSAGTAPGAGTVQHTTGDGCAFFAFVAPGTYTASLRADGFVDATANARPAQTTSITASRTATLSFQYDKAAELDVVAATDPAHPAPAGLPVTLKASLFGNASQTKVVAAASPYVITGLFPAEGGYSGWAGGCLAHDPGESQRVTASAPGGGRGHLVVGVAQFEVLRDRRGGTGTAGWEVTATHDADPAQGPLGVNCPSGESHTWIATDTDVLGGALPYGTWTFTLSDGSRNVVSSPVMLSPEATAPVTVPLVLP
jgi:prepilin-type N-terminal cleavage/methylation domain-containing protein